jgi:hypothetical protein
MESFDRSNEDAEHQRQRPATANPRTRMSIEEMYRVQNRLDSDFGIPGYWVANKSVIYNSVSHLIPKTEGMDFIDQERRLASGVPGHKYEIGYDWT